jgi:putative acetyltransferase
MPIRLSKSATGAKVNQWCGMFICQPRKPGCGKKKEAQGFVSVIDDRFLGALFVAPAAIRSGIGKALVQHVQQRFSLLSLEVYQKNQSAVNFYHALGFRIEDGAWQEETHHPTWIMGWQADQTP